MRQERIYIIMHPDKERFFVQPRPVTPEREEVLQKQGYKIYTTEVLLPIDSIAKQVGSTLAEEQGT